VELEGSLSSLQSTVTLESRNRGQAIEALQKWLTDRIEQWTVAIEAPMVAKLDVLGKRIDVVADRIEQVDQKYSTVRDEFPRLIDKRCEELLAEIRDLKKQVDSERQLRDEREKRLHVKLQDTATKVTADFTAEKALTEQRFTAVRHDLTDETSARIKTDEVLRQKIDEAVAPFPAQIAKEVADRTKADHELESALNHYTAALQDSIKIISTH